MGPQEWTSCVDGQSHVQSSTLSKSGTKLDAKLSNMNHTQILTLIFFVWLN